MMKEQMVRRRKQLKGGVGEEERRLDPPAQYDVQFVRRYSHMIHDMVFEISKPGEAEVLYLYPETDESKKWLNLGDNDTVLTWSEFTQRGYMGEPDMVQYNVFGRIFMAPLDGDTLNSSYSAPLIDGVIEFLANNPILPALPPPEGAVAPPGAVAAPSSSATSAPPLLSAWQGIGGKRKTKAKKSKRRVTRRHKITTVKFAY